MNDWFDEMLDKGERIRPFLGRLKFLEATERDACEKIWAFQGISEAVIREEWERLGRAQRLKGRLLERFHLMLWRN